jgi:hypothetical protein
LRGAVVVLVAAFVLWLKLSAAGPLRLTLLYATNDAALGPSRVFELVNQMDETVTCSAGRYQQSPHDGFSPKKGDYGAEIIDYGAQNLLRKTFVAHTTSLFQVWSPTNGGPYRFVVLCLPASRMTAQYYASVRFRVANFVSRWVHSSFATSAQWSGVEFAASPPFEVKPAKQ